MTADPWETLVDQMADQVTERVTPRLVDAVEARKLPALAVSVAVAAEALAVSQDMVRQLVKDGHLDTLNHVGTACRITVASLHTYTGHPLLPQLHAVPDEQDAS